MSASGDPLDLLAERLGGAGDGQDVLIAVAHPDDETIGVGGHLDRMQRVTIVHVTDGAPRDLADARANGFSTAADYAAARRREVEEAVALGGHTASALICLGVPDQEAAGEMAAIARSLRDVMASRGTRLVLTHPFEGGHPDHDATAFAVRAACRMLAHEGLTPPAVVEMAFYNSGSGGPRFQRFAPGGGRVLEVALAPDRLARKRAMIAAHRTQARTLALFGDGVERFRAAPAYDFAALPNEGRLLYEMLPLHFTGADWQRLHAEAARDLGEDAP